MSKTPRIEKILEKSKEYLEDPIALVEKSRDPPTVGDKLIVRRNNVIILAIEEILRQLEILKDPVQKTSKTVEALDLAKKQPKAIFDFSKLTAIKLWDPNEKFKKK